MLNSSYALGGAVIAIHSAVEYSPSPAYSRFAVNTRRGADFRITVERSGDFPEIPDLAVVEYGNANVWYDGEKRMSVRRYAREAGKPMWPYVFCEASGRRARVCFSPDFDLAITERLIFEAADVFRIMAPLGGIVLHSSLVLKPDGKAIVFCGPSGVGKSTQAEIWRKYCGARVINGDRALLVSDGGSVTANGVFFAGTSGICENASGPLEAIILLRQGKVNAISWAEGRRVFAELLNQCSYYPWDAENMSAVTEVLSEIMTAVPVYELSCLPDASAAELLEKTLKEAENAKRG